MVCVNKPPSWGGQLAEEEASKGQFHQLTFVERLAQHAAQELVVEVKVLVDQMRLQNKS